MFTGSARRNAQRGARSASTGLICALLALSACGVDPRADTAAGIAGPRPQDSVAAPARPVAPASEPVDDPVQTAAAAAAPDPAKTTDPAALPAGRIQSVRSPGGAHELLMQSDGNLVLYANGDPVWATRTVGVDGAVAELKPDGNLVVAVPGQEALWTSGTAGSGAVELVVTDDGNLALVTASGARVWQAVGPAPAQPANPPAATRPPAAAGPPAAAPPAAAPPAASEPEPAPAPAAPPVSSDYGLAGALIAEINAYRQANGLGALQVSAQLNGYAQACAADMAAVDAPLAHCRGGEIVQYNTYGSPHAWLVAFQNSPSHNAIMLLPDITSIGGGVTLSPGGRYYSVINVA